MRAIYKCLLKQYDDMNCIKVNYTYITDLNTKRLVQLNANFYIDFIITLLCINYDFAFSKKFFFFFV